MTFYSLQSGRGIVEWKVPPKLATKEPPRQPTDAQSAAATRLSQGLSTNINSSRGRGGSNNACNAVSPSVVLDEHSQPHLQQASDQTANQGLSDGSTRASRLLEERNTSRIRTKQARTKGAAVLRQQVYHFDPNY